MGRERCPGGIRVAKLQNRSVNTSWRELGRCIVYQEKQFVRHVEKMLVITAMTEKLPITKGILMIKDMMLTVGYHNNDVAGVISLSEVIERHLQEGNTIRLAPALKNNLDGTRAVVGLSVLADFKPAIEDEPAIPAEKVTMTIERLHEAYRRPSGTWWQRWVPFVCKHKTVRCIHGDEINVYRGRRIKCLVCGRALKGAHPKRCFFNGELHDD